MLWGALLQSGMQPHWGSWDASLCEQGQAVRRSQRTSVGLACRHGPGYALQASLVLQGWARGLLR